MEGPDIWVSGVGHVTAISEKKKGFNCRGNGFDLYLGVTDPKLCDGIAVGQKVQFRASLEFNMFEKAWRVGKVFTVLPATQQPTAKAA